MNSHSALIGLTCDDVLLDRISFCLPLRVIYERVQQNYGRIAIRPYMLEIGNIHGRISILW